MKGSELRGLVSVAAGLTVFGIWMSIVGNPHVVETVIGMALSAYVGYKVYSFSFWSKSK